MRRSSLLEPEKNWPQSLTPYMSIQPRSQEGIPAKGRRRRMNRIAVHLQRDSCGTFPRRQKYGQQRRPGMSKINRREFLDGSAKATLAIGFPMKNLLAAVPQSDAGQTPPANTAPAVLPGTAPLTMEGDLATQMVDGIHRFLLKRTARRRKSGRDFGIGIRARREPMISRSQAIGSVSGKSLGR